MKKVPRQARQGQQGDFGVSRVILKRRFPSQPGRVSRVKKIEDNIDRPDGISFVNLDKYCLGLEGLGQG